MKNLKYFISFLLVAAVLSCTKEDNGLGYLDNAKAPSNVSALFTITQDNSGKVTVRPNAEGATYFEIFYGDNQLEPATVNLGKTNDHIYKEGTFTVKIVAIGINGLRTEITKMLDITFVQPIDFVVNAVPDVTNTLKINVSASAKYEMYFDVTFGDNPSALPVSFNEGQTVSHLYAASGTYSIKVVAYSGGAAFNEITKVVIVTNLSPAPIPTQSPSNVISMFSNTYTNVAIDTWRTSWSQADLEDITIAGNDTKKYKNLNFVGIEATTTPINATSMTFFHTDVRSSDFTSFKIKLVDFGANGTFGGGDDKEHEVTIPNLVLDTWMSIDIPLTAFTGLTTRAHIAQLIFVGAPAGNNTIYIDNVYFYKQTPSLTVSPTPTIPQANVISLFSDVYTNVMVDTWKTSWSNATFQDILVSGNAVKKYSALDFVGIEATTSPIDATAMTYFHTDFWTGDATTFKIKLVDFGANGTFGGGDDKEHQLDFPTPAQNTWVSLDLPLSSFTGLTTKAHIAQLIYVGAPSGNNTVYIDNVYFHN